MPSLNELDGEHRDRPPSLRMPVTGGSSSGAGGVKSGRADTFNPSVFQSANHIAGVDSDQVVINFIFHLHSSTRLVGFFMGFLFSFFSLHPDFVSVFFFLFLRGGGGPAPR